MPGAWEVQRPEVVIGIISKGLTTIDWAVHLAYIDKPPLTEVLVWKGVPFDVGRNRLVKDARERNAKYIFYLDDDIIPPKNCIPALLAQRLPIISGIYWAKTGHPALWQWNPDHTGFSAIVGWPGGVFPVDAVPAGCLLVDMRVFDRMEQQGIPWFEWTLDDPKGDHTGKFSEDLKFCANAQKASFSIHCHPGVICRHETIIPVDHTGKVTWGEGHPQ